MPMNAREVAARKAAAADKKNAVQRAKEIEAMTKGYINNVKDSYQRWDNLKNAPAQSPEAGQFWGALLQNRKYDRKGRIK